MIEAYPLCWPLNRPRAKWRASSKFKTAFGKARDELIHELKLLRATHVTLSTNVPLRHDGLPYANMREPTDPGAAVYFTSKGRQLCFACDRWATVKENVWAICKTIEALRGIERWGTGDMVDAAFTGFAALPPPARPWRSVLALPEQVSIDEAEKAYQRLALVHHPDRGGSNAKMAELNAAIDHARRELAG